MARHRRQGVPADHAALVGCREMIACNRRAPLAVMRVVRVHRHVRSRGRHRRGCRRRRLITRRYQGIGALLPGACCPMLAAPWPHCDFRPVIVMTMTAVARYSAAPPAGYRSLSPLLHNGGIGSRGTPNIVL